MKRIDTQQGSHRFANSSCRAGVKHHDRQHVSPAHLLPELRGEWVRKDLGRERKEFFRISERKYSACFECSRMPKSSVTAPCGVLTHTQAAPDGQCAVRGFSGKMKWQNAVGLIHPVKNGDVGKAG